MRVCASRTTHNTMCNTYQRYSDTIITIDYCRHLSYVAILYQSASHSLLHRTFTVYHTVTISLYSFIFYELFHFDIYYPTIYLFFFFFFNDTAPPEISPLPLHDALPISPARRVSTPAARARGGGLVCDGRGRRGGRPAGRRAPGPGQLAVGLPGQPPRRLGHGRAGGPGTGGVPRSSPPGPPPPCPGGGGR